VPWRCRRRKGLRPTPEQLLHAGSVSSSAFTSFRVRTRRSMRHCR
jgi:hypothetical protein